MLRKHMYVNKGWCEKPSILYTIPPSRWIQLKSSVNTKSQKSTLNLKMLQYFSFPEKLFLTNQFSFKTFRMNLSLLFWCMHVYEHVYKWKCVCVLVCVFAPLFVGSMMGEKSSGKCVKTQESFSFRKVAYDEIHRQYFYWRTLNKHQQQRHHQHPPTLNLSLRTSLFCPYEPSETDTRAPWFRELWCDNLNNL